MWWLLALCFLVRLFVFFFAQNYDGDTWVRSMGALQWSQNPYCIWHADDSTWVFGPLPFYLNGLALMVWDNARHAPRIVSLVFGTLAIIPLYKLVELKFTAKAAGYASLAFCFYTLHVRYSAVATSEAINSFFILAAVYLFARYAAERRFAYLIATPLTLNLATMVRYENLIFAPLLGFLLVLNDRPERWRVKQLLSFDKRAIGAAIFLCAASLIFMASRFVGDFVAHGDAIYSLPLGKAGLASHTGMFQEGIARRGALGQYAYTLSFWPGVTFLSLTPIVAIFAVIGWINAVRSRTNLRLCLLFAATFILYVYLSTVGESMATFARFSITFTLFLIPFAGAQWDRWCSDKRKGRRRFLHYSAVGSLVACFGVWSFVGIEGAGSVIRDKISSISPVSRLPVYVNELIEWLNQNAGPDDKVLIDDYRSESALVRMYADLPGENFKMRWKSDDEVLAFVRQERPRFIVYANDGSLRSIPGFEESLKAGSIQGLKVFERYTNRVYRVYEVTDGS
jgi:4-amino-4-deoxy-L-arabinose transferase-like glycosyltransferase